MKCGGCSCSLLAFSKCSYFVHSLKALTMTLFNEVAYLAHCLCQSVTRVYPHCKFILINFISIVKSPSKDQPLLGNDRSVSVSRT